MLGKFIVSKGKLLSFASNTCSTRRMKTYIPTLYVDTASPPCRFVMMTADILGIELNLHHIDLFKLENLSDSYKKINYLQKVPAMSMGDKMLVDSHAISLYLCEEHQTRSRDIYPQDIIIRSRIHEMMFYNSSTLFPIDSAIFSSFFAGKEFMIYQRQWTAAMDYLEFRLTNYKWLAGSQMTLCDLCCGVTVSSLQLLIPQNERYKKINDWMERLSNTECFVKNENGLQRLATFVEQMKSSKTLT